MESLTHRRLRFRVAALSAIARVAGGLGMTATHAEATVNRIAPSGYQPNDNPRAPVLKDCNDLFQRALKVTAELVDEILRERITDDEHRHDITAALVLWAPFVATELDLLCELGRRDTAREAARLVLLELEKFDEHVFDPAPTAATAARTIIASVGGGDFVSLRASSEYHGPSARRRDVYAAKHRLRNAGKPIPPAEADVPNRTRGLPEDVNAH